MKQGAKRRETSLGDGGRVWLGIEELTEREIKGVRRVALGKEKDMVVLDAKCL